MERRCLAPAAATATALLLLLSSLNPAAAIFRLENLQVGFYEESCPNAEELVRQSIANFYDLNPGIAAGIMRLFFHDCFVRGCDASVLLDQTKTGELVEKDSPANGFTLVGLDAIDDAKLNVENACPQTVSCADILAFAVRDSIELAGLPRFDMPAGRRDGTVSREVEVLRNIPTPFSKMSTMSDMFAVKGFTKAEMTILSGAHSIGGAQCDFFSQRLYNILPTLRDDVKMEPMYADLLRQVCPENGSERKVNFDPDTPDRLDASYYKLLMEKRGLLITDQLLMTNNATKTVVKQMARNPQLWADQFVKLIVKMGSMDVLVGNDGEVRTSCRFVN